MFFLRVFLIFIFSIISLQAFSFKNCEDTFSMRHLLTRSIKSLNFSTRTEKRLDIGQIHIVKDLITQTEQTLLRLPGFSKSSLAEVNSVLSELGLHLETRADWLTNVEIRKTLIREPTPEEVEIFVRPINSLQLSLSTKRSLMSGNIHYVGELVTKTRQELLQLSDFNRQSFVELNNALSKANLHLDMKIHWSVQEQIKVLKDHNKRKLTPEEVDFFSRSVKDLNLSTRTKNILIQNNIDNLGSVVIRTEWSLKNTPSLGEKSFIEIKNMLSKMYNLHLGMNIDWSLN